MRRLIFVLLLLACPSAAHATTYYVAADGADTASGAETAPWRTLARVAACTTIAAGDSVLLRRGDTWREALALPASGVETAPITYGAYGAGARPRIDCADTLAAAWTRTTGGGAASNVLYSDFSPSGETGTFFAFAGDVTYKPFTGNSGGISESGGAALVEVSAANPTPLRCIAPTDTMTEVWCEFTLNVASFSGAWQYAQTYGPGLVSADLAHRLLTIGGLYVDPATTLWYFAFETDTATVLYCPGGAIDFGRTYRVLMHWRGGTAGRVECWIDSAAVLGETISTGAMSFGEMRVGNTYRDGVDATYWIDDLRVGDTGAAIVAETVSRVWTAPLDTDPQVVLFGDSYGYRRFARAEMTYSGCWSYESGALLVYADGAPDTVYTHIAAPSRAYGVASDSRSWWIVNGLEVANAASCNIWMTGEQSHNVVRGCTVRNAVGNNVNASAAYDISDITIEGVESWRGGSKGIAMNGQRDWTIRSCTSTRDGLVSSLAYRPSWPTCRYNYGAGISIYAAETGTIVERCAVSYSGIRDDSVAICTGHKGYGIWLDTCDTGTVRRSRVWSGAAAGLFCEKSARTYWYYNLSWYNGQHGLRVDAETGGPAVHDNHFYNNSLYASGIGINVQGGSAGVDSTCYGNVFVNNIATANAVQLQARYGGENDGAHGYGNMYTYNCFGAAAAGFIEWGGAALSSYDAWETAYGAATHSVETDPRFTAP
jgi:hypothetical protein